MELRVWFWGSFSVLDVHWQKLMEKGGRDGKKGALVLKVHDGAVLTLLHIESALLAYSHAALPHHQKSSCFIQQFSKKCIISSGDKTHDLSCEGMISRNRGI